MIAGQALGLCTSAGTAEKTWKRKLPTDRAMLLSKPQGNCECFVCFTKELGELRLYIKF